MEFSELTTDVEAAIAAAYDSKLPIKQQRHIEEHLTYIRKKLKGENSLIQPIEAAIIVIQQRNAGRKSLLQRALEWVGEHIVAAIIVAVIAAVILAKFFGIGA